MLSDIELNEIYKSIVVLDKEALDGDEVEQIKDFLNIKFGNILDIGDKSYTAFSIHKDDLREYYNDDELKLSLIDSLTENEMIEICKRYSENICLNDLWDSELAEIFEAVIEERRDLK